MPIDLANQTGLIPQFFYAIDDTGNKTVEINSNGALFTNLTTARSLGLGAGGFLVNGTTIVDAYNFTAIAPNPLSTELVINNNIIVQDADTLPANDISIKAGQNGVGVSYFGLNYNSATDQDFVVQTDNTNTGGVLFKQIGVGSTTTQTKINQGVITCSNTANSNAITINPTTGANATISLTNSGVGYTNPTLLINNSNATAGNTTGVPSIELSKTGRYGAINDVVGSLFFNALDGAGVERTFGKIESTITTNTAPSNYDGAIDFYSLINGVNNLVFRLNGADNENNSFRPLDLNGQDLKSSSGNMGISTASSTGTGNMTITAKANLTETGNSVAITSVGTGGDAITLTSAGNINLVPASGGGTATFIRTDSSIQTLTSSGGNKIDFIGGNADERFNIAKNDMTLHWNNAITDTATITLENDISSLNSAINMTYTTGSGNMGTTIQNIPSSQRILQTDGVNSKTAEYSPNKVELIETLTGRTAKIENNVNSGENRMDLFFNQGAGVVAQGGIVNTAGTQMLYLTHTDNANAKALSLRQDTSGTGKLQYDNTIDSSAFEITSNNTDLTLISVAGAGNCNIIATALNFNSVNIIPRRTYNTFAFSVNGSPSATILNFGSLADMVANTIWKVDVAFYTGDGINTSNVLTYVVEDTTNVYREQNSVFGYTQGGLQTCIQYNPTGTPMGTYCSFTDTFEVSAFAVGACSFILTGGTSNGSSWSGTCRVSIVLTRLS